MAAGAAPLPAPRGDMILRIRNATVTRSVMERKARRHLGAVYDAGGSLVKESLRSPDKYRSRDPRTLSMVEGLKVERRLRCALYLGHAFTHFGHFLIETVPALSWARYVDKDVPLLFHPFDEMGRNVFTDLSHGRECLALLGLPADRIVMATGDTAIEDLLLPPRHYDMRTGPRYDFREIYRELSAAARPSRPKASAARVYLSRRLLKPRLRRLSNEAAVERRMARRGFTIIHPQRMSLLEQINTAAAELVAGVDGSALHLSVFMPPGSRMLVMQTKRRRTIYFMNALMEVETIAVPATASATGKYLPHIDLDELDRVLDGLGCPAAPGFLRRLLGGFIR